jgi:glycosyltransferase involved in cell wall biosynthesis
MHRYCTYFDHRYLTRGLAMMRSLKRWDPGCEIVVLCLTPECHAVLVRLAEPGVRLIPLEDLERTNPDVAATKTSRSTLEYYFTLSGCIVTEVMRTSQDDDFVTYVDSDLMFYSSILPLYEEMAGASVGLIGHRYHWWKRNNLKFGYFNVCWTCFRCDDTGRSAAKWWRDRCIEWCHDYVDGDRFADQKYLDHMYNKFPNVVEIKHAGANVAPWNVGRHKISVSSDGAFHVDGKWPLIFFHFQGFREVEPSLFLINHIAYQAPLSRVVRDELYAPYAGILREISEAVGGISNATPLLNRGAADRSLKQRYFELRVKILRLAARLLKHYVSTAVLFIGPLPDPMMGQALACQVFLEALRKKYTVHVIDLNKEGLSVETAVFRRIGQIVNIVLQAHRLAKKSACGYFNLSQSFSGNFRDLLIFLACFKLLPSVAVHLHGGPGMREVLSANRLLRLVNRFFFWRLGAVIVLGQRYVNIFDGIARPHHVRIVPNFASEDLYSNEDDIYEKFPVGQTFSAASPLRLLFLSNHLPGKGHKELLQAYEALSPQDRACVRLDFAGGFVSDKERKMFISSIRHLPLVQHHGVAKGEEKKKLFRKAHIFCLPTYYRYEGQPISILESYASGCAVLTTNHSGIPDIFAPGRNGYVVDEAAPQSIKQVIEQVLWSPSSLQQIALNNRRDAELYPTAKYNERLLRIITDLMPDPDREHRLIGDSAIAHSAAR